MKLLNRFQSHRRLPCFPLKKTLLFRVCTNKAYRRPAIGFVSGLRGRCAPAFMLYVLCCARILLLFCNIAVAAVDRVSAGGAVPPLPFFYRIPLLFGAVKGNRGQTATIEERLLANACYTVWNRDGGQFATLVERPLTKARHTIGNCDGSQTATIEERLLANARYTVRNRDGGQTAAMGERPIANTRYTVGNRDRGQPFATGERIIPNACYATVSWNNACLATQNQDFVLGVDKAVVLAVVDGVSVTYCDTCQSAATGERPLANTCYTVWNRDGG